jgi:chloramphenicol-sensitive protein RarD
MNNQKHYGAAILAFVMWGFFSIPLRALQEYSAGEILYFRILFTAIVLAAVVMLFKRGDLQKDLTYYKTLPASGRRLVIMLTLTGGALLTVNWLTFIYIVNHINIKTASFSYMICPVITAMLGYVLMKESLTRLQWLAVGLCALSCAAMGFNSTLELGYSVLTAFTYALYLITQRKNQGFDRIIMLGIQVMFALILLNLFYPVLVHRIPTEGSFYGIIMIIAVFFTAIPLFLNLFALNKINAATIGILMYLNPIFNFTIAFVVFGEKVNILQVVSYGIIIVSVVLFNYNNFKKLRNSSPFAAGGVRP